MNLADFNDDSVQQSFKTALARTINLDENSGEVVANDVNITKFVEVSVRRRLDLTQITRFSLWNLFSGNNFLNNGKQLLATQLDVSWELYIVVQAFLTETSNPNEMTDEDVTNVVKILNDALGDGTLLSTQLQSACQDFDGASPTCAFDSVSAIVSSINISNVQEVFLKSSEPTSAPSAAPTGFYDNAKLDEGRELGPLALSQFGWLIGICISMIFFV